MDKKVSKTRINKTAVSGKTALYLVQQGLKTGATLESLLTYTHALKIITIQLEDQLKSYKENK